MSTLTDRPELPAPSDSSRPSKASTPAEDGTATVRVLALIDQQLLADWLDLRLTGAGMRFLGRAQQRERLVEEVEARGANLLIVGATLPGDDPMALVAQFRRERRDVPCVVLSKSACGHQVGAALEAGVSGFFTEHDRPDEILEGLRSVRAGKLAFGESVLECCPSLRPDNGKPREAARHCSPMDLSGMSRLTPREREVFSLMGQGLWRTAIATKLCRSPKTIDKHRASIMKKLDLHDHASLVLYAVREGLVDPDHSSDARSRERH
jgi:DNA-binding NarL/FixJ family response regulator